MNNWKHEGENIAFLAPAGGVVASQGLLLAGLFGVVATTAAEGEPSTLKTTGVFTLPKAPADAWAQGVPLYWDDALGVFKPADAVGRERCAVAESAGVLNEATARVKLTGVIPSVDEAAIVAAQADATQGIADAAAAQAAVLASANALLVAKQFSVIHDADAANGKQIFGILTPSGVQLLYASVGGDVPVLVEAGGVGGDGIVLYPNADPALAGAVALYMNAAAVVGQRLTWTDALELDGAVQSAAGRLLPIVHDAAAQANGVPVYLSVGAAATDRLRFVAGAAADSALLTSTTKAAWFELPA